MITNPINVISNTIAKKNVTNVQLTRIGNDSKKITGKKSRVNFGF